MLSHPIYQSKKNINFLAKIHYSLFSGKKTPFFGKDPLDKHLNLGKDFQFSRKTPIFSQKVLGKDPKNLPSGEKKAHFYGNRQPICGSFDLKTRWRVEAEDAQRFHEASRNSPSFGAKTVISRAILWDFMVIF